MKKAEVLLLKPGTPVLIRETMNNQAIAGRATFLNLYNSQKVTIKYENSGLISTIGISRIKKVNENAVYPQ